MASIDNTITFSEKPKRLIMGWAKRSAIGIVSPSYGTEKVSYGIRPRNYTFHKLLRIPFHRFETQGTFWKTTPVVLDYPVELVHTFNEIPYGIRPFVVSFENELPRYLGNPTPWQVRAGLTQLASDRCKKILAISNVAARYLSKSFVDLGMSDARSKISVFRGAIPSVPFNKKNLDNEDAKASSLKVLFVGRDAFGKGLIPTLDALDRCRAQGARITATVICNFEIRKYISKGRDPDPASLIERMRKCPETTHHFLLPHQSIQELMSTHDVLIFPTLDESLGWVAVEAALSGMPVISTDIYAIPELIIHGKTGFLIPIEMNHTQRWNGLWLDGLPFDEQVARTFATLTERLEEHIMYFAENRHTVRSMGLAGRFHMEAMYGMSIAESHLDDIYQSAIHA
jgi:glycosyltransferase involved in cell wall biosynthesis